MKRALVHLSLALLGTLLLLGLQSHFYFLPFPAPALWIVVYCFFSFYRSLTLSLVFNGLLALSLSQFSVVNVIALVVVLNILSFFAQAVQNRFHLAEHQILLSIGPLTVMIQLGLALTSGSHPYAFDYWGWLTLALSTIVFAPIVFYPVLRLDERFRLDPLDSMEIFVS